MDLIELGTAFGNKEKKGLTELNYLNRFGRLTIEWNF